MEAPSSNIVKIWQNLLRHHESQNLQLLHFDPTQSPGACDDSEV